jgi:preprotein translocase subunit SecF
MRSKFQLDVIKNQNKFFIFSSIVTILGILALSILGFNYGVDFSSGTSLDLRIDKSTTQQEAAELFQKASAIAPEALTVGGENNNQISARFGEVLSSSQVQNIEKVFKEKFGDNVSKEENTVDPSIAKELATKAIYGVIWACLGIVIYVSIRFEWRFAIAAIVALLHDAFIVISIFSILRFEVNLPFVAAILTIIGYSINDTIVIFDRIRENLRFAKLKNADDLSKVVNDSVRQTLKRSIYTVLTVLFPAICLFIFGSPAIQLFSLAIVFGLISGAYSSIFIASPIWFLLKKDSLNANKKVTA